jgi:hypothetical protein
LSQFDKCFAAAWLDDDRVLFGTKDNKLAVLNTAASAGAYHVLTIVHVYVSYPSFQPFKSRKSLFTTTETAT